MIVTVGVQLGDGKVWSNQTCNFTEIKVTITIILRVLLVEAGGEMPWIGSVPGLVALLQKSPVDWAFKTEVQPTYSVECFHFGQLN